MYSFPVQTMSTSRVQGGMVTHTDVHPHFAPHIDAATRFFSAHMDVARGLPSPRPPPHQLQYQPPEPPAPSPHRSTPRVPESLHHSPTVTSPSPPPMPHSPPKSPPSFRKVITLTMPDGDAEKLQCATQEVFQIAVGEQGANIRDAIRSAFAIPPSDSFTVRDSEGCNVVLGYPSFADGGRYTVRLCAPPVPRSASVREDRVDAVASGSASLVPPSTQPAGDHGGEVEPLTEASEWVEPPVPRVTLIPASELYASEGRREHPPSDTAMRYARALVVGVNYSGTRAALNRSVENACRVHSYLANSGIAAERHLLADNVAGGGIPPTKENIISKTRWLTAKSSFGENLFFYFTGHSGEIRPPASSGYPNAPSVILPLDYNTNPYTVIHNDDLYPAMVTALPSGARLTVLCDCAHSGALVDLPHKMRARRDGAVEMHHVVEECDRGQVVMISTYNEHPTPPNAEGLLTDAVLEVLGRASAPTYRELLVHLRLRLLQRMGSTSHMPQISSTHPMHLDDVLPL